MFYCLFWYVSSCFIFFACILSIFQETLLSAKSIFFWNWVKAFQGFDYKWTIYTSNCLNIFTSKFVHMNLFEIFLLITLLIYDKLNTTLKSRRRWLVDHSKKLFQLVFECSYVHVIRTISLSMRISNPLLSFEERLLIFVPFSLWNRYWIGRSRLLSFFT